MGYAVKLSRRAERDLHELYLFLNASNSAAATRWFNGLETAIYSLERLPRRSPRTREGRKIRRPLRHLLYGERPDVYRVIYEIDDSTRTVFILGVRHGARDKWNSGEKSERPA
jgi:toxin ParE1/3/4